MQDLFLRVLVMFGLAGNGGGEMANITGMKVPGSMPGKAVNGNQGIGKTTTMDISGITVSGVAPWSLGLIHLNSLLESPEKE
jgi:hypothetical protein